MPLLNLCLGRIKFETGSGHPGYPGHMGHILSGSSGSHLLYKISGFDPDSTCTDNGIWP